MAEKSEMISRRRAFSILGLATLGLAVIPNLLTVSEADAQASTTTPPTSAATPPAPQTGTERRQARCTERTQRRAEGRNARQTGRTERAQAPQGEALNPMCKLCPSGECFPKYMNIWDGGSVDGAIRCLGDSPFRGARP